VDDLQEELVDRFGDLPDAVSHLLSVAKLKVYGAEYGVEHIGQSGDDWTFRFAQREAERIDTKKLDLLCFRYENRFRRMQAPDGPPVLQLRGKGLSTDERLALAERFLAEYKDVLKPAENLQNVAP
jgi:transcription-repair coupling factor (superfamily II helicase)